MTHPNENFPTNFPLGQQGGFGTGNQPSKIDLFTGWFAGQPKNMGNSGHTGASNSFNPNTPSGVVKVDEEADSSTKCHVRIVASISIGIVKSKRKIKEEDVI
ncbi:hypothetical protein PVK06_042916 [Gossypium arboreum]|uniref:Uncharacterized protein n=1 Tax=Gossypium arboreum TaxID=29729 RepID=A0ABR0MM28_GOSAR|nr:hypothetical protein PVK06_042916 [Gossypium arboreum]